MIGPVTMSAEDLDAFAGRGLEELRAVWQSRYGVPPKLRSPELLAMMLAWRIQAEEEGGIESDVRRTLRRSSTSPGMTMLPPSSRLSREWQGVRHEVTVEGDGKLRWGDGTYRSLSEVARAITGSRWNGPRFFGLREGGVQ